MLLFLSTRYKIKLIWQLTKNRHQPDFNPAESTPDAAELATAS